MSVNIYRGDLEACRVCLATDIKLISLQDNHLKHIYSEFSGVPMAVTDSLPQHICVFCCALLRKCFKFRQKCKDTNSLLMRHLLEMHALTTSFIDTLDRSHLKIPLTVTDTLECHCIPVTSPIPEVIAETSFTETVPVLDDEAENIESFDYNSNQDCDAGLESKHEEPEYEESKLLEEATEAANTVDDEKQEQKYNLNTADKILSDNEERIEDFKNTYCNKVMKSEKETFYLYILEKYFDKVKMVKYNDLLMPDSKSGVKTTENPALISTKNYDVEYSTAEVKTDIELCNSTQNMYQKRFYEFINCRYINKSEVNSSVRQNKVRDIDRMNKTRYIQKNAITKDSLAKMSKECNVDVKLLLKEEKIQDLLERQETDKYKNARFKCGICYTGFASERTFQNHKAIHDPSSGAYVCDVCRVRFRCALKRTRHMLTMHRYRFSCRECGQVMRSTTMVREHHKTHSGLKYTCKHCNETFNTYSGHINHVRIHHGSVSCDICHMKFTSEAGLVTHKTRAHKELFKCGRCLVSFHNDDALRRHQQLAGAGCGARVLPCTQCGDGFEHEPALVRHMIARHPRHRHSLVRQLDVPGAGHAHQRRRADRSKEENEQRKELTITSKGKRKRGKDAPTQTFMCEICAKDGFKFPALLRIHQRKQHSEERPFACQHCHKAFKDNERLKVHMTTHTDERRYRCARCPKAFRQQPHLVAHMRVHSDERPYPCDICAKQFKARRTMQDHVRAVHEGQPPRKRTRRRTHTDTA